MARASSVALTAIADLLRGQTGVPKQLSELRARLQADWTDVPDPAMLVLHAGVDLEDRANGTKYPQILIHCSKTKNLLTEKFRKFSGIVEVAVEIRVSHDRLGEVDRLTQIYTDAVTAVLEDCRGELGECVFFSGRYEIEFGPAKKGGRHFVQITKIHVPVEAALG